MQINLFFQKCLPSKQQVSLLDIYKTWEKQKETNDAKNILLNTKKRKADTESSEESSDSDSDEVGFINGLIMKFCFIYLLLLGFIVKTRFYYFLSNVS